MRCPSDQTRLADLLGELSVNETREFALHRSACGACTAARREDEQLLADLSALPQLASSEEDFTASVMRRCETRGRAPALAKTRVTPSAWLTFCAMSTAAALALWAAPSREPGPALQARGGAATRSPPVHADVLVMRDRTLLPLAAEQLKEGDALAVRVTNLRARPAYLAVFARDAHHELHWIYPAYTDETDDPRSTKIPAGTRDQLLEEVVGLEAPALGELEVFAVSSDSALRVHSIEALPRDLDADHLKAALGGANVQTWRTTWHRD
jgi:hypothetical protein